MERHRAIDAAPTRPGTVKAHLAAEKLRLNACDGARFEGVQAELDRSALPSSAAAATYLLAAQGGRAALTRDLSAMITVVPA